MAPLFQCGAIIRGEGWFSIPWYHKSSSICIPNMIILVCMVVEKSLMKNVIFQSMDGKKIGQIQGRISMRGLVSNPTIQQIIINLHTKYENSSLHGCWEIFDEIFHSWKYGGKENWTSTGKKKQEMTGSQSHDTTMHHKPGYQIW